MSAEALFSQASSSRASGDLAAAATSYAAAIALRPTFAEAYLNVGWVLSELVRRTGSNTIPTQPQLTIAGSNPRAQGRNEEAVSAYEHGL